MKAKYPVEKIALWISVTGFITALLIALIHILVKATGIMPELLSLGPLGDYLGGITSPFISLAGLILLYGTYKLQKKEMQETAKELKEQRNIMRQDHDWNTFNLLLESLLAEFEHIHWIDKDFKGTEALEKINYALSGMPLFKAVYSDETMVKNDYKTTAQLLKRFFALLVYVFRWIYQRKDKDLFLEILIIKLFFKEELVEFIPLFFDLKYLTLKKDIEEDVFSKAFTFLYMNNLCGIKDKANKHGIKELFETRSKNIMTAADADPL